MEVILLEKIDNLGNLGDCVKVKSGYGRNFLVPSGKAAPATAENVKVFEERRAELEAAAAETLAAAQKRAETLNGVVVTIKSRTAGEGKLYGSVNTLEVATALEEAGYEVGKNEIRLPNGPIRAIGEYPVIAHLHSDVDVDITVNVLGEE
jgi:large subunit ribosomal protein L9